MVNKFAYIVCLIMPVCAAQVLAAGDPSAGAQKVQMCAGCHGPEGNSLNPAWPKLAGQHAEYIVKQLQDFKDGVQDPTKAQRTSPVMAPMTIPLSSQDMEDIAAYYSGQTLQETPLPASVEPKTVTLGETIYRAGDATSGLPACMACHGPGATGNPAAMYPGLAGQHAAYTSAQLQAFKTETRSNDTNNMMRDVAGKLTNEEIDAVSQYIQGLSQVAPAK